MNLKKLNRIAILAGLVAVILVAAQFQKTYEAGEPKWNYLVMASGLAIVLFYSFFGKRNKTKR